MLKYDVIYKSFIAKWIEQTIGHNGMETIGWQWKSNKTTRGCLEHAGIQFVLVNTWNTTMASSGDFDFSYRVGKMQDTKTARIWQL